MLWLLLFWLRVLLLVFRLWCSCRCCCCCGFVVGCLLLWWWLVAVVVVLVLVLFLWLRPWCCHCFHCRFCSLSLVLSWPSWLLSSRSARRTCRRGCGYGLVVVCQLYSQQAVLTAQTSLWCAPARPSCLPHAAALMICFVCDGWTFAFRPRSDKHGQSLMRPLGHERCAASPGYSWLQRFHTPTSLQC